MFLANRLRAAAGRRGIPTNGLVAWYTMDNISGSTLVDEMGNYDGTITGATTTTGVIDDALLFDGAGDIVEVNDGGGLAFDVFSVSFWMKADVDIDDITEFGEQMSLTGRDNEGVNGWWFGRSREDNSGELRFGTHSGNIKTDYQFDTNVNHVVLVQRSDAESEVWVNGQLNASGDNGYTGASTDNILYIGGKDNDYTFGGWIDQYRVYNRALSEEEIQLLYEEGA